MKRTTSIIYNIRVKVIDGRRKPMSKFKFDEMPQLRLLSNVQIEEIHEKAVNILGSSGVIFDDVNSLKVLSDAGCQVDAESRMVKLPRDVIEKAIMTAPGSLDLYDRDGNFYCTVGDGVTRFNPGSSAGNILTGDGVTVRPSGVADLKLLTKVAQSLDAIDFVSSSVVCEEAPGKLGSQYLYYTEMQNSVKPIIGGATDVAGVPRTFKLLEAVRGSRGSASEKPYSIFDICVTSPLKWSHIACSNILDCAANGIPVELISAQIAGATGPVTLTGAILQHTVELLSGLVLAQTAAPGLPVIYGGAPCIFNMKTMYTPMEAMESTMITAGYTLMGKYYGLPVHTYAAMSDAKTVDYQAGMETARSGMAALLAGVDNVSGAGGLNVIAEMSIEKLVMDADFIGTLKHMAGGLKFDEDALAEELIMKVGPGGNYLGQKHTLLNFRKEQNYDNIAMNYQERAAWNKEGGRSVFETAAEYVDSIREREICALDSVRTERLDNAFIDVCLDSGLTKEDALVLIEACRKA